MITASTVLSGRLWCELLCGLFDGLFARLQLEQWLELLGGLSSTIAACSELATGEIVILHE